MDTGTIDDILTRIDAKIHGATNDEEDVEFELRDIMDLRGVCDTLSRELFGVRKCSMPKFIAGDEVRDKQSCVSFYVSDAEVSEGSNGYEWNYRRGFYFIPESDLELVKPRGVR